jgi:hypothetical protein
MHRRTDRRPWFSGQELSCRTMTVSAPAPFPPLTVFPPFEFAAKLQAELGAVDWITAEQKVARDQRDQADADVYGWAGGVLVCFEIRGGRMPGWRQRPCTAAAARRYLERSAPGWAAFAQRSAELAARLRSPRTEPAVRLRPSPPGTCAG